MEASHLPMEAFTETHMEASHSPMEPLMETLMEASRQLMEVTTDLLMETNPLMVHFLEIPMIITLLPMGTAYIDNYV